MEKDISKDIDCIIAKVLAKEAGIEDIITFGEWVNSSETNSKTIDILSEYWQYGSEEEKLYAEISFSRNKGHLFGEEDSHGNADASKHKVGKILLSIAASLLLLIVGYWYIDRATPTEKYILMASNGIERFTLPDSSRVVLNSNSRLTYTDRFLTSDRNVVLEGEAYFEVTKKGGRKFTVEVGGSQVEVLGTKFNIDARNVEEYIVTTLVEGSVVFRNGKKEELLSPNHQLTYHTRSGKMENVLTDAYVSTEWKDNVFRYNSVKMSDLMRELGAYYGVEIIVTSKYSNLTVSGAFSKEQPLEKILRTMQNSVPFRWKMEKDRILMY